MPGIPTTARMRGVYAAGSLLLRHTGSGLLHAGSVDVTERPLRQRRWGRLFLRLVWHMLLHRSGYSCQAAPGVAAVLMLHRRTVMLRGAMLLAQVYNILRSSQYDNR